jgi:hypothetical protein
MQSSGTYEKMHDAEANIKVHPLSDESGKYNFHGPRLPNLLYPMLHPFAMMMPSKNSITNNYYIS